ncbi:right-handed parallel beta-helix repeat-containing protein [Novosphingobium subterraneum]|uniref:right-handed parallel beta-helix repeat-containing protein n=1 Tax=Novosphingobium subterraneum TaxID=48936 RepID=UPI003CFE3FAF
MSVITVSTSSQLVAALTKARAGDVISLLPGDYSSVTIKGINPTGTVTITSADPSAPVALNGLKVTNSSNLAFDNLHFAINAGANLTPFSVMSSSNIAFSRLDVGGQPLGSEAVSTGLIIRGSQSISVADSNFHDLRFGILMLDNSGVTVTQSLFHDIRTDGIRGGGNSNVTITSNAFTDFHPAIGDHADAIQFWTTNTLSSASNIVVSGNVIERGNGDATQGIFFRDEVGNLPFLNVTISDNAVIGGLYNGITADGVKGGSITNNIVAGFSDQTSWLRVQNSSGLSLQGNTVTGFVSDVAAALPAGNTTIAYSTDDGAAALTQWLKSHDIPAAFKGSLADFLGFFGHEGSFLTSSLALPTSVTIQGTNLSDKLVADITLNSFVYGGAGDDTLTGNGVHAQLTGGEGNDTFIVKGAGDLVIELAGQGTDTVNAFSDYTLTANVENLRLSGTATEGAGNELANRIIGNGMDNVLRGLAGDDTLQGGDGNDRLFGDDGADVLRGDAGNDRLEGGLGDDQLFGGEGSDVLFGGAGNDILEGGAGSDILTGGAGADVFRFRADALSGSDVTVITDFARGYDRIDLRAIDAIASSATNDAFSWIGSSNFTKHAGELQVKAVSGGMMLAGDVNGDGIADFRVMLQGLSALSSSDVNL